MATVRGAFGELFSLADMGDLDGTLTSAYYLDLTGSSGCIIIQGPVDTGGDGGAGIDVIEFSRDGGLTFQAATAALIKNGHAGLMAEDGTAAAIANAAMNSAGVEPTTIGAQVFSLGPPRGPFMIRCGRKTTTTAGTTWTTHAPAVAAIRIG